jgi:hypothetical protein
MIQHGNCLILAFFFFIEFDLSCKISEFSNNLKSLLRKTKIPLTLSDACGLFCLRF